MSNGSSKSYKETAVQVLATIMIPVSVAGTGLYYTRWQQNLSDLKTMIDLVSDQNPERRKYGVAMFEYLLKNDKVPVEFVAAQLSFANSSADRNLLPMMEQALYKAAAENSTVEETFRQALERLPSRLTIHAMNDKQRSCFSQVFSRVGAAERTGIVIPGFGRATWGGSEHELRYFLASDEARAGEIAKIISDAGLKTKIVNAASEAEGSTRSRPNSFELWLGSAPMPAFCG